MIRGSSCPSYPHSKLVNAHTVQAGFPFKPPPAGAFNIRMLPLPPTKHVEHQRGRGRHEHCKSLPRPLLTPFAVGPASFRFLSTSFSNSISFAALSKLAGSRFGLTMLPLPPRPLPSNSILPRLLLLESLFSLAAATASGVSSPSSKSSSPAAIGSSARPREGDLMLPAPPRPVEWVI